MSTAYDARRVMDTLTTVPIGCFCAGFVSSSASSMTRLRNRSYPRNVPLTLRPPCRWTKSFLSMNCTHKQSQPIGAHTCDTSSQRTFLSSGWDALDMVAGDVRDGRCEDAS